MLINVIIIYIMCHITIKTLSIKYSNSLYLFINAIHSHKGVLTQSDTFS